MHRCRSGRHRSSLPTDGRATGLESKDAGKEAPDKPSDLALQDLYASHRQKPAIAGTVRPVLEPLELADTLRP